MKSDELLDMIGDVDDKLIAEAENANEITDCRGSFPCPGRKTMCPETACVL